MRIITGRFKGRTLRSVRDRSVRPATDRVKESIFNTLQSRLRIDGADVLDLFAGTGSLGFEALSRGARHVTFVDDNRSAIEAVEQNATQLGCPDSCEIIRMDAVLFVRQAVGSFDLIFADPPYAYDYTSGFPSLILSHQLLKTGGFLIIEHARRTVFDPSPLYRIALQKEFGNTHVSFFIHGSDFEG